MNSPLRTRIKFCGLVRPEDVDTAVALGVDAVGFVFYPPSPRALDVEQAGALRRRLPSFVQAVGLFVNAPNESILQTVNEVGLDVIQLHGDETPETLQALQVASQRAIWRAIRMRSSDDLLSSISMFGSAECLLLDSFSEGFGGSGKTFDWSWIPAGLPARLILSGGLDVERVGQAIRVVRPFAVDVSSGIQGPTARSKDPQRMEAFVAEVLRTDALLAAQSGHA
jgi:phosphoribosylanthranilate isomerase